MLALQQELRMLGHNKRVLLMGAHPDDEDTELLTVLVRGMGAEAAYLSLNRGEGGQNLIGRELGEALGLIRTEELLAARRLDGARQYFTRAYDFGYTKSIEETWRFWPPDSVLKDVVGIVREFRPQIIVSIFSPTSREGHGQHQVAGWAAQEVFRIAGDPSRFPGLGTPWQPLKLYRSTRFDSAATTLTLDGGVLDEAVGQTFRQIAMRGRSLHRSQDMGQLQRIGPSSVQLQLLENRTGQSGTDLFAGIDTSLGEGDSHSSHGEPARALRDYSIQVDSLRSGSLTLRPGAMLDRLGRAERALRSGFVQGGKSSAVLDQLYHLGRAKTIVSGILVDAIADDDRVVPGQTVGVVISVWNPTGQEVTAGVGIAESERWKAVEGARQLNAGPRTLVVDSLRLQIRPNAGSSQPYFLQEPRNGGMYRVATDSLRGRPFESAELTATFALDGLGEARREVSFRLNDQAYGERRRPIIVVPRVDVKLDPLNEVWPTAPEAHDFTVSLTHGARDSTRGSITLEVPAGWPAVTAQKFEFTREDERENYRFSIRPPANLQPGKYEVRAVATDDQGRRYNQGVFTIEYPHIRPRSWTQASTAVVNVAPLEMARLKRVGYIRGASDMVPEALASVGVPVVLLDPTMLERGDLSIYDAIVVGSRAYETDPALVEYNGRLLAYARNGGLVIVQYQQQVFFNGNFAPFRMRLGGEQIVIDSAGGTRIGPLIGHDRVTDETAPVTIIDPTSPVVNRPNRLGAEDWKGWVQERGLYFARSWDEAYKPVLEMADRGEAPLRGGLLVARYGRGIYVYTGISFFRELPAGVPGAFRLFANLLALGESSVP